MFTDEDVYTPPENSAVYNGGNVLGDIICSVGWVCHELKINGDLNGRISNIKDYKEHKPNVPGFREMDEVIGGDIGIERKSQDTVENKFGKEMISLCRTYSCYIVNGRFGALAESNGISYISSIGCNKIDYFIVAKTFLFLTSPIRIIPSTENSQLQVAVSMKRTAGDNGRFQKPIVVKFVYKFNKEDEDNSERYQRSF